MTSSHEKNAASLYILLLKFCTFPYLAELWSALFHSNQYYTELRADQVKYILRSSTSPQDSI